MAIVIASDKHSTISSGEPMDCGSASSLTAISFLQELMIITGNCLIQSKWTNSSTVEEEEGRTRREDVEEVDLIFAGRS